MPTVLITGANRGIGQEFTRQYLENGWHVLATCRAPEDAVELHELGERFDSHLGLYKLDVTDSKSLAFLRHEIQGQSIDLLINNAGAYGPSPCSFWDVEEDEWLSVLRTNTVAPLKLTEALYENLFKGEKRLIAFISSQMGSVADNSSGGSYIYRSSKAALNAVVKSLSIDLAGDNFRVVALHPGWVRTRMGGPGALISTQESVEGLRHVIDNLTDEQSGSFLRFDGEVAPW